MAPRQIHAFVVAQFRMQYEIQGLRKREFRDLNKPAGSLCDLLSLLFKKLISPVVIFWFTFCQLFMAILTNCKDKR
jgi:Na+-translocating ferredoxin:NAD+ oxidoreductase RnfD subunit